MKITKKEETVESKALELVWHIVHLTKNHPNDAELGAKVRKLFGSKENNT